MDPILQIIQYLFKKKNIENNDDTFDSFFGNGVAFPKFVALAFKIDEIPHINKNPKLVFHKNMNNSTALQYLFDHNPAIAKISPNYTTDRDKAGLLSLILTKQCFSLNLPAIIEKCNLIVKPFGIKYSKKNEILTTECILSLLNILTDGKVPVNAEASNFDLLMKNSFELANAPLVINKSSLEFQNQFVFLIQLEILFEFFEDKINQIIQKESNSGNAEDIKNIERLKEIENKKKLEKEKEMERLKKLKEQEEFEKLKKLEKQKEIEKQNEIKRQKEIEKQKELEQDEIKLRQKLEEEMRLQKEQEDEKKDEGQINDDNLDTEIDLISNEEKNDTDDLSEFTDFDEIKEQESDSKISINDDNKKSSDDSDIDINDESTEVIDSIESSNNQEDRKKRLSSKFLSSDWKSLDISSSVLEDIEIAKSESDSDDDVLADIEAIEVKDIDEEEEEEEETQEILHQQKKNEDHQNNHFDKFKSKFKRTKKENEESEELFDCKLLKVINAIHNKNFEKFHQTIENDELPKFVMFVLNRQSIKNVILTKEQKEQPNLSKSQLKNIKEVINYLKKKEPKFRVLLFDFNSLVYAESSAILFYRTFINYFYLKSTKKQLFERCVTLLFSKIKKEDLNNEVKLLTNWDTYISLACFIFKKKLYFDPSFNVSEYFEYIKVPFIIDKNFLDQCSNLTELPISIYCQLQFIFDRIDQTGGTYRIVEIFSKALRGINMKVPKSDALASSIRAKNISLILQKKEYKNYIIQKNLNEFGLDPDEEEKEIESNRKKMPVKPLSFVDRQNSNNFKNSYDSILNTMKLAKNADSYWNPPDSSFSFDNGIFYRKSTHNTKMNQSQIDWTNEMKKIQKGVKQKSGSKSGIFNNQKEKLYIFFKYDRDKNKWEQVFDPFNAFWREKKINKNEMKTPLILFINSNDDDLKKIAVNSKIVNGNYPDLDENQIFVYGLGDKTYTKPNPLNIEGENEVIKPIFLFLHVPMKLKGLPNISTIIYSIYTFLYFICDIEIIVLNKNYYNDQIEIIKSVNYISSCYKEVNQFDSDFSTMMKTSSELHLLSASNSSDEENEIFDDSDFEYDNEMNNEERNDYQNDNFTKFSSKLFTKNRKIIALVNDESDTFYDLNEIMNKFNENSFFMNKKLEINPEFCQIHYINSKDFDSYKSFMKNLTDLVLDDESLSTFDDVSRNFRFVQLTEISSQYIKLKNEGKWEEQLTSLINKRYSLLAGNDNANYRYLTILANLRDEIFKMSPSIDLEFKNKCDSILSDIKKKESTNNRKIFIEELEKSSNLNLNYLNQIINNEKFWFDREKENLKNSHVLFLKDEFFSIIKTMYNEDLVKSIYEENRDILNDRIKKDIDEINSYFLLFKEKQDLNINEKIGDNKKIDEIKNKHRRGSNYTIREAENTREIIVTVQIHDDLKSEIKQDF